MGDRLEKLKALEAKLYVAMETAGNKELPAMAKQYRDTLREIEEIEGGGNNDDDIAELLEAREADGKPGAVRPSRS